MHNCKLQITNYYWGDSPCRGGHRPPEKATAASPEAAEKYHSSVLSISAKYPAVITPEGKAIIAIPNIEEIIVTILPIVVTG